MFNNIIEKFTTRNIFHYHKNICRCAYYLIPELYKINLVTIEEQMEVRELYYIGQLSEIKPVSSF